MSMRLMVIGCLLVLGPSRVIPLYAEPELTLAFVFQKTLIRDLI